MRWYRNQMVWTANQLTGFYMMATLAFNELIKSSFFPPCFSVYKSPFLLLLLLLLLILPLSLWSLFVWLLLVFLFLVLLLILLYSFVIVSYFHCCYSYQVNIGIIVSIISFVNFLIHTFAFYLWISTSQVFF